MFTTLTLSFPQGFSNHFYTLQKKRKKKKNWEEKNNLQISNKIKWAVYMDHVICLLKEENTSFMVETNSILNKII